MVDQSEIEALPARKVGSALSLQSPSARVNIRSDKRNMLDERERQASFECEHRMLWSSNDLSMKEGFNHSPRHSTVGSFSCKVHDFHGSPIYILLPSKLNDSHFSYPCCTCSSISVCRYYPHWSMSFIEVLQDNSLLNDWRLKPARLESPDPRPHDEP